jgi:hypothetical protein
MAVKAGIGPASGVLERARVLPPPRDGVDCLDMIPEALPGWKKVLEARQGGVQICRIVIQYVGVAIG